MISPDPGRGCGLLVVGFALSLLVCAVVAAFLLRSDLASLTGRVTP